MTKTYHQAKDETFNNWNWQPHGKKGKQTSISKIDIKFEWIKGINAKSKTLNFLGENRGDYCFDPEAGNTT